MSENSGRFESMGNERRKWPENCAWPEPLWDGEGFDWDWDLAEGMDLDEDGEELKDIKYYMDELVEEGRLNSDYSLNEDYEDEYEREDEDPEDDSDAEEPWRPEKGIDYWDDGFDVEMWEEDLSHHINLLKIESMDPEKDPMIAIRQIIRYEFINENLLRQAFTRRAFAVEQGLSACSEELEFYGDAALNTVVTREIYKRFSDVNTIRVEGPFESRYNEGELTKLRATFVSKEYLAARAAKLGLDRFILYGTGETASDSAREDMMEALIGAVAADCGWKWPVLEDVIDRLIQLQLRNPGEWLKVTWYDQLNSWHQKRFGRMPEFEIHRKIDPRKGTEFQDRYDCSLRYSVPENDKGVWPAQRIYVQDEPNRSRARERAAELAVRFIQKHGLWMNLKDAGIEPRLEDSINQLQELYQKKYVEKPEYSFEEREYDPAWYCRCSCNGVDGWGTAASKTAAKKKAAFMTLERMMGAG